MKLQEGYLVKEIACSYALLPIGQSVVDYRNIFSTNETGNFILENLQKDICYEDLFRTVCMEYATEEQDKKQLKEDLDEFLADLREKNLLCE